MGADLYLVSVMNQAADTYRPARELAMQALHLAQKDPTGGFHVLARDLFEAVRNWFTGPGTFDPELYDLTVQVRDLAQGETSAWLRELCAQLLRDVRQSNSQPDAEGGEGVLLDLVQQVSDLMDGRTETAALALLAEIEERVSACLEDCCAPDVPGAADEQVSEGAAALGREEMPQAAGLDAQSLAHLARKMRYLASGIPLDAIADLTTFLLQQEKIQRALGVGLDAKLGGIVDRIQATASEVTADVASLPLMVSRLQYATIQWRSFVQGYFGDLDGRIEEIQATASEGGEDLTHEETQTLLQHLGGLAERIQRELSGWQSQAQKHGEAMVRILCEAGVNLPQRFPSLEEVSDELTQFIREAGKRGEGRAEAGDNAEAETEPRLHDLMDRCMHLVLQRMIMAGGGLAFFAQVVEKTIELTRGQTAHRLTLMATSFVEHVRPSDGEPEEEPDPVPVDDGDAMDGLWYQLESGVRKIAEQSLRRCQEEEVDLSSREVFPLSIQLRNLVCGDPSSRMYVLAERMAEILGFPSASMAVESDTYEQEAPDERQPMSLARQVCGLLQGDPRNRLRTLMPDLLAALQVAGAYEPLAIVRQMEDLLQGKTIEQMQLLVRELVNSLEGEATLPDEGRRVVCALSREVLGLLEGDPVEKVGEILRMILLHIVERLQKLREITHEADASLWGETAELSALLGGEDVKEVDWDKVREILSPMIDALSLHTQKCESCESDGVQSLYASLCEQTEVCALCLAPQGGASKYKKLFFACIRALLQRIIDDLEELAWPKEGHFRDNYSEASVLWMARWFWQTDVVPLVETDDLDSLPEISWWPHDYGVRGLLPIPAIRQIYQRVQEAEPVFPTQEKLARWRLRVDEAGDHSIEGWHASLCRKRERLLAFLDEALRREESILCSL